MSAYANSLQKPQGFEFYVRKFRAICVLHDVQIGSRRDLPGFLRKLMEDRPLAMDFWKLIGKLSNREGGELADDEMLAVIVEGVTGGEALEDDAEQKRTVEDLRAMLAGVDIQSPIENCSGPVPSDEPLPQPLNSINVTTPDHEADRTGVIPPATSLPQVNETLLRHELSSIVKEYFDNIDKRISRLEPHSDEATSTMTPVGAPTYRSIEDPSPEAMEEPRLRPVNTSRLVLEPVAPTENPSLAFKSDSSERIPLEGYSEPEGFGRAIAALVIVLVLAGGAFAGFRYRVPLRKEFVTASQIIQQKIQQIRVKKTSEDRSAPTASVLQTQPPAEQPPSQNTSTQPQANSDFAISPPQAPPVKPQPATSVVGESSSGRKEVTNHDQALDNTLSSADEAGAVRVNPAVMEANLIVSRVPVYPEVAKEKRVEGIVVMQVIISRQGTVRRVHVLEGDSRLRAAAIESVYKRQYTPYRLDGEPVEVVTTVTVNFNLDQ